MNGESSGLSRPSMSRFRRKRHDAFQFARCLPYEAINMDDRNFGIVQARARELTGDFALAAELARLATPSERGSIS